MGTKPSEYIVLLTGGKHVRVETGVLRTPAGLCNEWMRVFCFHGTSPAGHASQAGAAGSVRSSERGHKLNLRVFGLVDRPVTAVEAGSMSNHGYCADRQQEIWQWMTRDM